RVTFPAWMARTMLTKTWKSLMSLPMSSMKSMKVSMMKKMRMNTKKKKRSSEKHKVNVFFHEHLFLVCPCSVNSHLSFMKQSCEIDLIFQDGWSTIFTGHYKFRNDKRFPDVNGGALLFINRHKMTGVA